MQFQQNQKVLISGGTVTVGTITGTVNVAGTVAISGGSVSISGTPNVNVTGGSITISSGSVSISAGTITSITNTVSVANDILVIIPTFFNAALPVSTTNSGPTQAITGMKLIINSTAGTVLQIAVSNTTTLDSFACVVTCVTANNFPIIIPLAADISDGVHLSIIKLSGAGTTVTYNLLGFSQSPDIATPPGQPLTNVRLGGASKTTQTLAGAGTVALLAAPPAGMSYCVKRVVFAGAAISTAGGTVKVVGHTSGIRCSDYNCVTAIGIVNSVDDCDGLLYAEGIDLVNTAAAGATADIHYDLISTPAIQ